MEAMATGPPITNKYKITPQTVKALSAVKNHPPITLSTPETR